MQITITVPDRGCIHVDESPTIRGVRIDLAEFTYGEGFFVLSVAKATELKLAIEAILTDIEGR